MARSHLTNSGSTDPRPASRVVAASNASAGWSAGADYVCDGTSDDVEIQAAITALSATGGTVILSDGLFTVDGQGISTLYTGIHIKGQGIGATTIKLANNQDKDVCNVIYYTAAAIADVSFSDFTVDGNETNNNTDSTVTTPDRDGHSSIYLANITGLTFTRIEVQETYSGAAIRLGLCANITITGCTLHDNEDTTGASGYTCDSIYMGDCSNVVAEKNIIGTCTDTGFATDGTNNLIISNNIIRGQDTQSISVVDSPSTTGGQVSITGNVLGDNNTSGYGIKMFSNRSVVNLDVSVGNNIFVGCDHGIGLGGGNNFKNVIISDNFFDCTKGTKDAILFEGTINNVTISDNMVSTNTSYGVNFSSGTPTGVSIYNNDFSNASLGVIGTVPTDARFSNNRGYSSNPERSKFVADILAITGDTPLFWIPKYGETTTSTDASLNGKTITYSKNIQTWDTLMKTLGKGSYATLDGVDEEGDTPDSTDLSFGDGAGNDSAFSIVALINPVDATSSTIISKYDNDAADEEEWIFSLDSSDRPQFLIFDDSVPANIGRRDATALTQNTWSLLAGTYDATEASTGINIYLNGAVVDDTDVNSGVYSSTQDGASPVQIGFIRASSTPANYFDGRMAFVLVCAKELSAAEVWRIKELVNAHYELTL